MNDELIVIHNQDELNRIGREFDGMIEIHDDITSELSEPIVIQADNLSRVDIFSKHCVHVFNSKCVCSYDKSHVRAYNSKLLACGGRIYAYGSHVETTGYAQIDAYSGTKLNARGRTQVKAHHGSYVNAYDRSQVYAYVGSRVSIFDDSYIELFAPAQCRSELGHTHYNLKKLLRTTDANKNFCDWVNCHDIVRKHCGSGDKNNHCMPFNLYQQLQRYENLIENGQLIEPEDND